MINKKSDIIIIGGGIGGLNAALCLKKFGFDVCVFEQASQIKEVGAGIQISPNAICVLNELGLQAEVQKHSVAAQGVQLVDYKSNKKVAYLDINKFQPDLNYQFFHRADLLDILYQACLKRGIDIVLDRTLLSIDNNGVHFSDGSCVSADIIIGADGLHSMVRHSLLGTIAPFFTRQVAWRAIVPNKIDHPNIAQITMAPKRHVVSYPIRGGKFVNLVLVQEQAGWHSQSWSQKDDPDCVREVFSDFSSNIKELLSEIDVVHKWGLFRYPIPKQWFNEKMVLLGDAAHPTLPFLAQGAAMAIEDGYVLAQTIAQSNTPQNAFERYYQRRIHRVRRVIEAANKNAWKYHLSSSTMRFAAHSVMRTLSTVAPKRLLSEFDWLYRHDVTQRD